MDMDISHWASGVYFYKLTSGGVLLQSGKLVKW